MGKCFRDEDELAAAHSLPEHITNALRDSSALIVVCSPETKDSIWVQREIETFIELHNRERVFVVLAAGDASECMPEILRTRTVIDVDGEERTIAAEPLAADFRPESANKLSDERLRIIASVAGCGFDDLRQRQRARKRKRITMGAVAALVVAVVLGGFAWTAHTNQQAALIEESRTLAAQSQQLYSEGDRYGAIDAALQALPTSESDTSRPLVSDAQQALENALQVTPSTDLWLPCYSVPIDEIGRLVLNEEEKIVGVLTPEGEIPLFNLETGKAIEDIDSISQETIQGFFDSRGNITSRETAIEIAQGFVDSPNVIDAVMGGERLFVCTYKALDEDKWDQSFPWKLQAYNTDLSLAWEYEDISFADAELSLRINGNLAFGGLPFIASYYGDGNAVIVIVRNKAIVLNAETGEKMNELAFPMPVVSASFFTHKTNSEIGMLYAACADGSVLWKNPFDSSAMGEGFSSKYQIPAYISQAAFALCENGELYLAAFDDSNVLADPYDENTAYTEKDSYRLLVYRSNRHVKNDLDYGLDELIALAHKTLEAAGREVPSR